MIFKKNTEVEILEKGSLGSWRPARILSGNGHTYLVKYDGFPSEAAASTNRVPRKALRPRPPPAGIKNLACNDYVEVNDCGSWKIAEVLMILDSNTVVARLLGSSMEIVTPVLELRVPQTWTDNRWIPLQKESLDYKNECVNNQLKLRNTSSRTPRLSVEVKKFKKVYPRVEKYDLFPENMAGECGLDVYPHVRAIGKKKLIKKKGRCHGPTEKDFTNHLFQKVETVNSPQNFYGEKHISTAIYHEIDANNAGSNLVVSSNHLHNESTTSSVGSCSAINGLCRPHHHKANRRQELYDHIDDAESFCGSPTEPTRITEDKMPKAIHCLELDAYRSTLRSLYSQGFLSWDQESLLTSLRFALNISNDEHLSVIKDLLSARN